MGGIDREHLQQLLPHTMHINHLLKLTTNLFNLLEAKSEIVTGESIQEHSVERLDAMLVVTPVVPTASQSKESTSMMPWHSLPAKCSEDNEDDDLMENDTLELGLHIPHEAENTAGSLQ